MEMQSTVGSSAIPTGSGVDELSRRRFHHGLHPRGNAELAARPLYVKVDRAFAESEDLRDLGRRLTSSRPGQCLELSRHEIGAHRLAIDAWDATQPRLDQRAQEAEVDRFGGVIVGTEPPCGNLIFPVTQR